ncbi:MAG: GcrA cell cycle regulator [Hyphomicrobiaceae bacterium]|nr:GcrA cell cycle regulator [Hyphomicrobiaceae bacterium]
MSWTDERVELLKKYWSEGLSASQIAGRLGGITRNAVIGKVHRLGLSGRSTTNRLKSSRPRRQVVTTKRVNKAKLPKPENLVLQSLYNHLNGAEPYSAPAEEVEIPIAERKSLQDLTENSCRWPIGDPQTPEFHFCNAEKVPGLPYCEHHSKRAFHVPQSRKRRSQTSKQQVTFIQQKGKSTEAIDA